MLSIDQVNFSFANVTSAAIYYHILEGINHGAYNFLFHAVTDIIVNTIGVQ